jgi:hypothetical protein
MDIRQATTSHDVAAGGRRAQPNPPLPMSGIYQGF